MYHVITSSPYYGEAVCFDVNLLPPQTSDINWLPLTAFLHSISGLIFFIVHSLGVTNQALPYVDGDIW